jgi:hypothetical protein
MKRIIAVLFLLVAMAFAQKPQCQKPTPTPPQPTPTPTQPVNVTNTNSNTNVNQNTNTNTSTANASQGQQQGQQQQQSAVNGGNAITENNPRNAPPAIAPPVLNGFCLGGISAGVSSTFGGLSFGKSTADKNCQALNLAAFLAAYHNFDGAAKVICSSDAAKRAHLKTEDCKLMVGSISRTLDAPPISVPIVVSPPVSAPQVTVPVTVNVPPAQILPAPPEYRTIITVTPPKPIVKKKPVHHLPPDCQNVVTVVCAKKGSNAAAKK